jgi:hypothetical protein
VGGFCFGQQTAYYLSAQSLIRLYYVIWLALCGAKPVSFLVRASEVGFVLKKETQKFLLRYEL